MSIRIKICGITNYEDAKVASKLGVDALGFIFYSESPRYISPVKAAEIIRKLPPFISRVGVFVDEVPEKVMEIARITAIDTIQLHGKESPEYCRQMALPVIKAFSIESSSDITHLGDYQVSGFLLDTWKPGSHGGTGATFDWSIARRASARWGNIILAGGLGPSNLLEALEAVDPYGVDVNSGVEIKPGVKNPHKMREAVNVVKNWKAFDKQPL